MRGELIRVLSEIEEKANELKLDGYNPDVVVMGREAYEFVKTLANEEFGGDEELLELSGLKVRIVDELGGDALIMDSRAVGFEARAIRRIKVVR
ncbi:family 4A encapsulin nanocompartment shell protein [Thermococcus waiotapuensis]|uniref:Family 4A encapsulin nanocompartment shell protein n=1 Tax=Thermococcus waiotapuensis TaxID=90909 RepID=A0AAE4NYQ8_9EURY|nr:family 4A encapsulin nanocompartment shell protein [Thermococcus waiotapuensis]MDV3104761.1 family 4A encapsulin nanocompartment shell protein [Thermococcus waiotapuensis]